MAGVTGFVGRTQELELVRAAVARAAGERRPTAVVVDGEPGVGKTRLIDEASKDLRVDRVAVAAYEPEMRLPFSLGHDLIRSLAHDAGAAHPEGPGRIPAIERELEGRGWLGYERTEAPEVAMEALTAVHPPGCDARCV